jgi:hypothetical protein
VKWPAGVTRPCRSLAPIFAYRRHEPEKTVLYRVVVEHLATLFAETRARSEHGYGYPAHVERAFNRYISCGILARGFARCRCASCGDEFLVAFSCKQRGLCPSCATRRMHDVAIRLVDFVLPFAPYRQWVLSPPWHRRLALIKKPALMSRLMAIFVRAIFSELRLEARRGQTSRRARTNFAADNTTAEPSPAAAHELSAIAAPVRTDFKPAAVGFVHLFGSALNLHPHAHVAVADGVFVDEDEGDGGSEKDAESMSAPALRFCQLPPPTDEQVRKIAARVARRAERMFEHTLSGIDDGADDEASSLDSERYEAISPPSLPRLDQEQRDDDWEHPAARQSRCANVDGYSVHANVVIGADDRRGLEHLLGYGLRPAFALSRLRLLADGRVAYQLKKPWPRPGGMTQLVLEPLNFLRRLACLIPPPRHHLTRYFGVLAPHSKDRARLPQPRLVMPHLPPPVAVTAAPASETASAASAPAPEPPGANARPVSPATPGRLAWARLMARVFAIDVQRCPKCGGDRVMIAFITAPSVIKKILRHLNLPTEAPPIAPARAPPQTDFDWVA